MFFTIHRNVQTSQRAARALRFSRAKRGCKGSRFAFLDLRRFAVSLEMPTDKSKTLLFSDEAELLRDYVTIQHLYEIQGAEQLRL